MTPGRPGTLYIVATPIGNLEDISLRAIRVLREAALVAAEDTRRTRKLLTHHQIPARLVSLHEHNELTRAPVLVRRLLDGESIALVSDAGTPGLSDPGAALVRAAADAGVAVVTVPGARKLSSVVDMVIKLVQAAEVKFEAKWFSTERYAQIAAAIQQFGTERLKPVKEALPEEITYGEIRLVAAHLRVRQNQRTGRGDFEPRCGPSWDAK